MGTESGVLRKKKRFLFFCFFPFLAVFTCGAVFFQFFCVFFFGFSCGGIW